MNPYADSGFLCSLYAPDAHTARAAAWMKRGRLPLPFTWIHQLEIRNAFRLRVFRKEITAGQRDASFNLLAADMAADVLVRETPPLDEVLLESERLSAAFSETLGTRSLDVLHVAAAVALGRRSFLTFDHRQNALARAAGLKTPAA